MREYNISIPVLAFKTQIPFKKSPVKYGHYAENITNEALAK